MLSAEYAAALDGRAREERMKKISDLILRSEARSAERVEGPREGGHPVPGQMRGID
jgi:hypothetical protein